MAPSELREWMSLDEPCQCPECGSSAIVVVHGDDMEIRGCLDCGVRWSERT